MSKTQMLIGIGIGIILLIIVIMKIQSNQKKKNEKQFRATRKMQEDALKVALSNNMKKGTGAPSVPHRPYKVEYFTSENQNIKERQPLLQLVEKNKLAEKKYIFQANEVVALGLQFGTVGVLNSAENAEAWCELYFANGAYCIRSFEKSIVYVQRNKKTVIVNKQGVQLKSGDSIKIQETTFQTFYMKV